MNIVTPHIWLFSTDSNPDLLKKVLNGFSLTGGTFKRTALVRFFDSNREEVGSLNIRQTFTSEFTIGRGWGVAVDTEFDGTLPQLKKYDIIAYKDFKQEYRYKKDEYSNDHIIESDGVISYRKLSIGGGSEKFEIVYNERFEFSSCFELDEFDGNPNIIVQLKDLVVVYDNDVIRFSQNHYMIPSNETDGLCDTNDCSDLATCYADRYNQEYTCTGKNGFVGDGRECVDNNECESDTSLCSVNAACIKLICFSTQKKNIG